MNTNYYRHIRTRTPPVHIYTTDRTLFSMIYKPNKLTNNERKRDNTITKNFTDKILACLTHCLKLFFFFFLCFFFGSHAFINATHYAR